MPHFRSEIVAVASDGSGDATVYTRVVNGLVHAVRWTNTDLDAGSDWVISGEDSGIIILTQTNIVAGERYPRSPVHASGDGSASLYAGAGEPVEDRIPIANERIRIVLSNGGATLSGSIEIWIEGG